MFQRLKSLARKTVKAALLLASLPALAAAPPPLQVGDLVFIRVPQALPRGGCRHRLVDQPRGHRR